MRQQPRHFQCRRRIDKSFFLSGTQPIYKNRAGWAHDRLKRAGLSSSLRSGYWQLTEQGRAFLASHPGLLSPRDVEQLAIGYMDVRLRPPPSGESLASPTLVQTPPPPGQQSRAPTIGSVRGSRRTASIGCGGASRIARGSLAFILRRDNRPRPPSPNGLWRKAEPTFNSWRLLVTVELTA